MRDKGNAQAHLGSRWYEKGGDQMDSAKKTMSVPEAGRIYYDLSRNASYDAAKRGEIPTIRIGRLLRVPVAAMERRLEHADSNETVAQSYPRASEADAA